MPAGISCWIGLFMGLSCESSLRLYACGAAGATMSGRSRGASHREGKQHERTSGDSRRRGRLDLRALATNRKLLSTAGESIERFVGSGIEALGDKLGPIVWQFMPTKQFDPEDFEAFLALLPRAAGGRALRHALDVRHESFHTPEFLALANKYGCVAVHTDSEKFPAIVDAQVPFAYIRLMRSEAAIPTGYPPNLLDQWAQGARAWAGGSSPREVFIYFISGAKQRAPAAAMALLERLRSA